MSLCVRVKYCLFVIRDKSATNLLLDPLAAYGVLWLNTSNNKHNNKKNCEKRAEKGRLKTLPQNFDAISAYIIKSGESDKGYPIDGLELLRLAFQYPIIRKTLAHAHTHSTTKSRKNKKKQGQNVWTSSILSKHACIGVQTCMNHCGDWFCDNRQKFYRLDSLLVWFLLRP